MMQKHRISTDIGKDQIINVEINQNFEFLEILSLKLTQQDVYTSLCSDYGVVCGRISVNNGFGIPNAKISIFIPLSTDDQDDPVISALYPYTTITDKSDVGYRYNLLPSRQQHGGHAPTGTFPDQIDILTREEVLEVYEKYYIYTVKTNEAGDFMIWGVPLGEQVLHIDVDLSDIGCFSLRPYDFLRKGSGVDDFKNVYTFKSSSDIDSLPQIKTFNKTIEVYPFWGDDSLCQIGITRTDFDLSSVGVKIEPKAYLLGGTFTDHEKNSINKNCEPRKKMGRKCDLQTKPGKIEAIRFTTIYDSNNRPILEEYELNEDIDDSGAFLVPIPMNMDFLYTNEFGENEYTTDPNKGVPTSGCYRLKFTIGDEGLAVNRSSASYLVPNIREYNLTGVTPTILDQSYAFSTNYDDYIPHAVDNFILYTNSDGFYVPKDFFYRFSYNKAFTVSSFQGSYVNNAAIFSKDRYVGIKELSPAEEEDCTGSALTPPINFGVKNYTFTLLIADILMFIDYLLNIIELSFANILVRILHQISDFSWLTVLSAKLAHSFKRMSYNIANKTQKRLYLITYPECDECSDEMTSPFLLPTALPPSSLCQVGTVTIQQSSDLTNRLLTVTSSTFAVDSGCTSNPNVHPISDISYFVDNQSNYILTYGDLYEPLSTGFTDYSYFEILTGTTYLYDYDNIFTGVTIVSVEIRDPNTGSADATNLIPMEEGCSLYDRPYNSQLITLYYVGTGSTRSSSDTSFPPPLLPDTSIIGTLITDGISNSYGDGYTLPDQYDGETFNPITISHKSEFSNGIFYVIPGSQSENQLLLILKEYYKRKRVAKMFCGGIVNYSFIDNWLSGSLYFFQFKMKHRNRYYEAHVKYCRDVVRYVIGQDSFYYRSSSYFPDLDTFNNPVTPLTSTSGSILRHPTTFVDLGPRDEFIKEICTDPNLDPNCSISRSIGSSSFQDFGEILGLAINYRLETTNDQFTVGDFFTNTGFTNNRLTGVFDGDLLQLISINNETGIEGFDLQSPKYLGYSYQSLDPQVYPDVFQLGTGEWGPVPITLQLKEDGQKTRSCINDPGKLTESSQPIPFYLWDKKGTGFGSYTLNYNNGQSWDYSAIQVQPLQGMTYAYNLTGSTDPTTGVNNDAYLLLPITYTYSGLTVPYLNVTTEVEFDVISGGTDTHTFYDKYPPGFTYLFVTSGTTTNPLGGTLYTRYGEVGTWNTLTWDFTMDFIIPQTQDYYTGNKQILSTPFSFYFGLKPGKTGLDKLISSFGPKGAFPPVE